MAEALDKQLAIVDVYAEALFALARQDGAIEQVHSELQELVKLQQREPGFGAFMSSMALDDDHRAAGLERMLRGKLSDITLNTLQVMNRHGRNGLVAALLVAFEGYRTRDAGEVKTIITSAVALDDATRERVVQTAAQVSGLRPVAEFRVDPAILGGLIVRIGDWRYDNSLRTRLAVVAERLSLRAEHGLGVGH